MGETHIDRTITYPTYDEYMRTPDPIGFHVKFNNTLPDGTIEIVYTDDPRPSPPPKRQLTESQYIREEAAKDDIDII